MSKNKQIFLPSKVKKEMEKTFKVSIVTIWSALNYISNSPTAKMLRAAALQRGGVIYDPSKVADGYMPDCITTFETAENTMIQRFSDRVHLIADLTTGTVVTYIDGIQVDVCEDINWSQFPVIIRQAELKAKELNN